MHGKKGFRYPEGASVATSLISNQSADVGYWHVAAFRCAAKSVGYWTNNGQRSVLTLDGYAAKDPKRTFQS